MRVATPWANRTATAQPRTATAGHTRPDRLRFSVAPLPAMLTYRRTWLSSEPVLASLAQTADKPRLPSNHAVGAMSPARAGVRGVTIVFKHVFTYIKKINS